MGLFKKGKSLQEIAQDAETMAIIDKQRQKRYFEIYHKVKSLNHPVTTRTVARHLQLDSASVYPRMSELVAKGRLRIWDRKQSMGDGKYRNLYVIDEYRGKGPLERETKLYEDVA